MKYLPLIVLLLLCFTAVGEVYVIVEDGTDNVISVSKRDDAVVETGQSQIILTGKLKDYEATFQYHPNYYTYKNGKFKLNTQKIQDEIAAETLDAEIGVEEALVRKRMRKTAIDSLIAEGINFEHIPIDGSPY